MASSTNRATRPRAAGGVEDGDRLTTVGLFFESAAGLRRLFEQRLAADRALGGQSFDVLIRLARTPGERLRMSELAGQTALSPSGLTRAVDRLEEAGLVVREVCPEDRRGAFAVLTAEGRAVMDRAIPAHLAHIDEVLDELLSPEEERFLAVVLRRIRDHLYFGPDAPTTSCASDEVPTGPGG